MNFARWEKFILILIALMAIFLIFVNLTNIDIKTDDAIYSFRSIGYIDVMDSIKQTTPLSWFGDIPWWSKLSFHDAPPLVFLIQHLFFNLFGVSTLVARLPFALAGVGLVILTFCLARSLYNSEIALLASFILAILSYHSWSSRVGYLEIVASFFIILTLFLFFLSLKNQKIFIFFGIALGLALLTKYTVFFILPLIFLYLLICNRLIFGNKYFIISIITAFLMFSPVIFYNVMLYQTRGHFDLQFSLLFNQDISIDWPVITPTSGGNNFFGQLANTWLSFSNFYSSPIFCLLIFCLFLIVFDSIWHYWRKDNIFIIFAIILLTVQFFWIGSGPRLLSLFNPFFAIILAWGIVYIYDRFINQPMLIDFKKVAFFILLILFFGLELFYNINTNILKDPIGPKDKYYSRIRWDNGGFNELEKYFINDLGLKFSKRKIENKQDLSMNAKDLSGNDFYIYDPRLNWFSSLWYFRRWTYYSKIPFLSVDQLTVDLGDTDWLETLKKTGVRNLYYIEGENNLVFDIATRRINNSAVISNLDHIFNYNNLEIKEIYNKNNQLAFKIYKLKLN